MKLISTTAQSITFSITHNDSLLVICLPLSTLDAHRGHTAAVVTKLIAIQRLTALRWPEVVQDLKTQRLGLGGMVA